MQNFEKEECCKCGILFAVSSNLIANWKKTKQSFYCPNGHPQSYTESTAEILKRKNDELERQLAYRINEINKLNLDVVKFEQRKIKKNKIK